MHWQGYKRHDEYSDTPSSLMAWGVASYFVVAGVTIPLATSKLGHTLVNALK